MAAKQSLYYWRRLDTFEEAVNTTVGAWDYDLTIIYTMSGPYWSPTKKGTLLSLLKDFVVEHAGLAGNSGVRVQRWKKTGNTLPNWRYYAPTQTEYFDIVVNKWVKT